MSEEKLRDLELQTDARIEQRLAETADLANRPLGRTGRILAFVGGCIGFPLLVYLIAWARMRDRGEYRKALELWEFGALGFAATMAVGIVVAIVLAR